MDIIQVIHIKSHEFVDQLPHAVLQTINHLWGAFHRGKSQATEGEEGPSLRVRPEFLLWSTRFSQEKIYYYIIQMVQFPRRWPFWGMHHFWMTLYIAHRNSGHSTGDFEFQSSVISESSHQEKEANELKKARLLSTSTVDFWIGIQLDARHRPVLMWIWMTRPSRPSKPATIFLREPWTINSALGDSRTYIVTTLPG